MEFLTPDERKERLRLQVVKAGHKYRASEKGAFKTKEMRVKYLELNRESINLKQRLRKMAVITSDDL